MGRAARVVLVLVLALAGCSPPPPPAPAPAPAPIPAPVPVEPDPPAEPWETEKDPVKAKTMKLEVEWRLDPLFTDVKLRFHDRRPVLVAVEEGEDGRSDLALAERVGRALDMLAVAYREFLREASLDAPTLAELGDERIRIMIFRNQASFDGWYAGKRGRLSPGPHYARESRRILCHGSGLEDAECYQLGAYALGHLYARHFCSAADAAESLARGEQPVPVAWDDPRLRSSFAWFERGLAVGFGSFREESGALREGFDRAGHALLESGALGPLWTLEDLLFADAQQVRAQSSVKAGGAGLGGDLESLAWIQGQILIRYFRDGEGGKRRDAFHRFVRSEFSGRSGKTRLLEAFGLVDGEGRALGSGDPKVVQWLREVDAGHRQYARDGYLKSLGLPAKPR